ncbi:MULTISPECIES: adenylosuccinate lyase [Acetoanaerobium]|uniref:Adenylosuccinate lyase n=1 Tax=Acetoanaerobium sticklandii (strain ATCC 12662 / DSM 519 / JCM 1433 / CCUG 9281 / NCIMB 10654 / HF) TaxID=499177 RepID=E3PY43_ACESD|nr:adenylosuccinate lyase [Acetoanaerobium sticklandii]CBH21358.1 Adenylosuccinate lyase (Adenylosuccinase) (ASL) (ASASE) [Acetoanaerobium sticklandii]
MINREVYQNPLNERYSSKEMSYIFSDENKFKTWRKLWIALAESQKELGLNIDDNQIQNMKDFESNINYDIAKQIEKETRHDVMSHVKAFGMQAELAKGIIHLGATSCYVGDNTDLINMFKALELIEIKLASVINNLSKFAIEYKSVPTLGFTHFQAAQLTTVGKRATLWLYDLLMDLEEVTYRKNKIYLRGVKGTTGTQASFLELFNHDHDKVKELDEKVCEKMGFKKSYPVTGQTYSRKVDSYVLSSLSSIAQSLHKMTNDIRLLQHLKELEEPFESTQIGSSAMAYKRNPMRSERISSLSKYIINLAQNPALVHSTQWLERTLDDSANRRLAIGEAFLATDAILEIAINVTNGLVVYENMINRHINEELPFMATEYILMEAVKKGGDRQELHEKIRVYSMEAAKNVKINGGHNNLIELLANDAEFNLDEVEIKNVLKAENFIGRSKEQVEEFILNDVNPILEKYKNLVKDVELNV